MINEERDGGQRRLVGRISRAGGWEVWEVWAVGSGGPAAWEELSGRRREGEESFGRSLGA